MKYDISLLSLLETERDAVDCYQQATRALDILHQVGGASSMVQDYEHRQKSAISTIECAREEIATYLNNLKEEYSK